MISTPVVFTRVFSITGFEVFSITGFISFRINNILIVHNRSSWPVRRSLFYHMATSCEEPYARR